MIKPQQLLYDWAQHVMSLYGRKLQDVPEKTTAVAVGLKETSQGVEPHFLKMGQILQTIYANATGLTRQIQQTTRHLTSQDDDNMLSQVATLAEKARGALAGHQDRVATSLESVKAVTDQLGDLFQSCDRIDRIAMNLRVVGLNIGVESTRSEEARDMFTVVSEEIVQLSNKVVSTSTIIRKDAETARADQLKAFEKMSTGLEQLRRLSSAAATAVDASVREIEHCIHSAMDVFNQSGKRSDDITGQVGEIVAGIQFHDNMRQRVEHISDALTDAMAGVSDPAPATSKSARLGDAHRVMALQTMQLNDVIKEIDAIHRQSLSAFETIAGEMKDLSESMTTVCHETAGSDGQGKAAADDPFERLVGALEQLKKLIVRADQLVFQIEESVQRAADIGNRFSQHMKTVASIGFETHIKALNAIIRAAHLGEQGRTLEVLAQEMSRLSIDTRNFVKTVEENMQQVSTHASQLQIQSTQPSADTEIAGAKQGHAAEILARGIEEINRTKVRLNEQFNDASQQAEALHGELANAINGLSFLTSLADDMAGYLSSLQAVMTPLKTYAEKTGENRHAGPGQLTAVYTMQRERDIHEKARVGQNGTPLTSGGSSGADYEDNVELFADSSEDDMGDNVELFADSSEDDMGDNVELFADSSEDEADTNVELFTEPSGKTKSKDQDFGDNVELF